MRAAITFLIYAMVLATQSGANAAPTVTTTEVIDLTKTPFQGLPSSFKVTLYRDMATTEKQPLVVLIPQFGAQLSDAPYREQAEYFTIAGYVVAIPHLTGLYNDGRELPVYDARMDADLATDTTPLAVEVLAMVATLSQAGGPATSKHVVLGQGLGSVIAARYAALGPPGCKGLIMISAGFGAKRSTMSSLDDMRASENAFKQLGAKIGVPSLWIYAKGNKRIRDSTANDLFAAFKSGSGTAQLAILPEIGMDGDALFSNAAPQTVWEEPVTRFLGSLDLK